MGLDASAFLGAITSGEETYKELASGWRGKRCLWLSKTSGAEYLEGTEITVADVEEADFILCSGTQAIRRPSLKIS